jgi:hypothetical protein
MPRAPRGGSGRRLDHPTPGGCRLVRSDRYRAVDDDEIRAAMMAAAYREPVA